MVLLEPRQRDLLFWIVFFSVIRFVAWLIYGNATLKGYTRRSYIVGIFHEGFVLPTLLVVGLWKHLLTSGDRPWDTALVHWLGGGAGVMAPVLTYSGRYKCTMLFTAT